MTHLIQVHLGEGKAGEISDHFIVGGPWPFSLSVPLWGNEHGYAEVHFVSACCEANLDFDPAGAHTNGADWTCAACNGEVCFLADDYLRADVGYTAGVTLDDEQKLVDAIAVRGNPLTATIVGPIVNDLLARITGLAKQHRVMHLPTQRGFMAKLAQHYTFDALAGLPPRPSGADVVAWGGNV